MPTANAPPNPFENLTCASWREAKTHALEAREMTALDQSMFLVFTDPKIRLAHMDKTIMNTGLN